MTTLATDEAIEAAAVARYGSARVSIVRQVVPLRNESSTYAGVWFVLFVNGECVCRRRTKQELWQLVKAAVE